jgi:hypothetical protein
MALTTVKRMAHDLASSPWVAIFVFGLLAGCGHRSNATGGDGSVPLDGAGHAADCTETESPRELTSAPFSVLARGLDASDDATAGSSSRLGVSTDGIYVATRHDIELVPIHGGAPVVVVPDTVAAALAHDETHLFWVRVVDPSWQLFASDPNGKGIAQLGAGTAGPQPRLSHDGDHLYVSGPCRAHGITAVPVAGGAPQVLSAACDDHDLREYDFLSASHGFLAWLGVVGRRDRAMLVGLPTWSPTRRNLGYGSVATNGTSFFGIDTTSDGQGRTMRLDMWVPERPESPTVVGTFHVDAADEALAFDVVRLVPTGADAIVVTDSDDGPSTKLWHVRMGSPRARLLARIPRGSEVAARDGHLYVTSRGVLYAAELSTFPDVDGRDAGCGAVDAGVASPLGFERTPWTSSSARVADLEGASLMAADDGLYLSTVRGIERAPLAGGELTVVVPRARAMAIHRDRDALYWLQRTDTTWEVVRSDLSGGGRKVLAHGASGSAATLGWDNDDLYVAAGCSAQSITVVPKRGGPPSRLVAPCDDGGMSGRGYLSVVATGGFIAYRASIDGDLDLLGPKSWHPTRPRLPFDEVASDGRFFYGEQSGDRRDAWRHPLWRWKPDHPELLERVGHMQDGLGVSSGPLAVDGGYALATSCLDEPVACTLNLLDIQARHATPVAAAAVSQLHGYALRNGTVFVHYGSSIFRGSVRDLTAH